MTLTEEDQEFLAHYGILGMKWGVRRSEAQLARARGRRKSAGKPVTDTKAGRRRERKAAKKNSSSNGKANLKSYDPNTGEASRNHQTQQFSQAELQSVVNRIRLEQQYAQLTQPQMSKGQKFKNNLKTNSKQMAGNVVKDVIQNQAKKQINNALERELKKRFG